MFITQYNQFNINTNTCWWSNKDAGKRGTSLFGPILNIYIHSNEMEGCLPTTNLHGSMVEHLLPSRVGGVLSLDVALLCQLHHLFGGFMHAACPLKSDGCLLCLLVGLHCTCTGLKIPSCIILKTAIIKERDSKRSAFLHPNTSLFKFQTVPWMISNRLTKKFWYIFTA